eukprot:1619533-Amphidinium_carterae.1
MKTVECGGDLLCKPRCLPQRIATTSNCDANVKVLCSPRSPPRVLQAHKAVLNIVLSWKGCFQASTHDHVDSRRTCPLRPALAQGHYKARQRCLDTVDKAERPNQIKSPPA